MLFRSSIFIADTSRILEETEESGQQAPNNGDRASGAGPSRGDCRGRGGGRGRGRAVVNRTELVAPGPMTRSRVNAAEFAKMQISLPLDKELRNVIFYFFSMCNCLRKSPEKSTCPYRFSVPFFLPKFSVFPLEKSKARTVPYLKLRPFLRFD